MRHLTFLKSALKLMITTSFLIILLILGLQTNCLFVVCQDILVDGRITKNARGARRVVGPRGAVFGAAS